LGQKQWAKLKDEFKQMGFTKLKDEFKQMGFTF
jgi:hypothetical protein